MVQMVDFSRTLFFFWRGGVVPNFEINRLDEGQTFWLKRFKHIPRLKLTACSFNLIVGRWISFWDGFFAGAMLVSGRVTYQNRWQETAITWQPCCASHVLCWIFGGDNIEWLPLLLTEAMMKLKESFVIYLEWPSFPVIVTADIIISFVGDTFSLQLLTILWNEDDPKYNLSQVQRLFFGRFFLTDHCF